MRRHRHSHDGTEVALANFALTFAKALLVFCVVLFLMISPKQGINGVKPDAQFLITIDWGPTKVQDDVDIWMRLPDGTIVSYTNKESGVVFLERDDLGGDCIAGKIADGSPSTCEETMVIRGIVPGEYEISLHLYSSNLDEKPQPCDPVQVHAKIEILNPIASAVWQSDFVLNAVRQEMPMLRFTVNPDGTISDFATNELPPVVYRRK